MSNIPPPNHILDAVARNGDAALTITSDGTPNMTKVVTTTGISLGLIQNVAWTIGVKGVATCSVDTVVTPAELTALFRDTTLTVQPSPGYHPLRYLWLWYTTKAWLWWNAAS